MKKLRPTEFKDSFMIEMYVEGNEGFFYLEKIWRDIPEKRNKAESSKERMSTICSWPIAGAQKMETILVQGASN